MGEPGMMGPQVQRVQDQWVQGQWIQDQWVQVPWELVSGTNLNNSIAIKQTSMQPLDIHL